MTANAAVAAPPARIINLGYLWWVAVALVVMIAAIVSHNHWALNFVHVLAGLMWTGIDLFMGFMVGPVLRKLDPPIRRAFTLRLMPRMIFLMPTLAIITGTAGWYLAQQLGYLELPYPQRYWVIGALVVIAILTIQGFGVLLPTNLRVLLELAKEQPDVARIGGWMRTYVRATAFQGSMQVAIIVIMSRFVSGV
jgi:hypothetical protein